MKHNSEKKIIVYHALQQTSNIFSDSQMTSLTLRIFVFSLNSLKISLLKTELKSHGSQFIKSIFRRHMALCNADWLNWIQLIFRESKNKIFSKQNLKVKASDTNLDFGNKIPDCLRIAYFFKKKLSQKWNVTINFILKEKLLYTIITLINFFYYFLLQNFSNSNKLKTKIENL
ncbi:hypothetical protein BpHYR1_001886 [Brachionus plicatilis]|uniref:Uncharacterized protein n=1 Tax=Brachionus plicatilis TaxID=10195 RepID=A0A3M7SJK3_BRAPC|nr:hypothetical protein BpHYR1_001886 [Brachionus plicatilis]